MTTPLDLADADGDRIRLAINPGSTDWPVEIWTGGQGPELDWRLEAALSIGQLAEILRWGVGVLGGEVRITGRPYTDEELARTPSVRRDEILTAALDEAADDAEARRTGGTFVGRYLTADAAASNPRNPDCVARKHAACSGDAWDEFADASVTCGCPCHNQHADPARPALTDEQRQARS